MTNALFSRVRGHLESVIPRQGEQATIALASILVIGVFSLALLRGRETIGGLARTPQFVIDPNKATEAELLLLPRVGPSLAKAIVEERARKPFETARDVGRTHGIGEKTLVKLLPHLKTGEVTHSKSLVPVP